MPVSCLDKQITLLPAYFLIKYNQFRWARPSAWLFIYLQLIITDVIRKMDLEVTCPRCQKQFADNNLPRLFTACGHTFCEKCMNQLAVQVEEGKVSLACPECPQGQSTVVLDRVAQLPKNVALFNFSQARKNNTSTRSINSLKDESFNVPKLNQSYHAEQEDEALMTAINGQQTHSEVERGQRKKERVLTTPVLSHRISESDEVCLLHNKQVQVVCLVDRQRLCSKCALFGQHRGHDVVSLDQVQQVNKQIYQNLLQIFDEKTSILDQLTSKKRRGEMIELITTKTTSMKKEISDKFKKIQDELAKTQKAIYHKLEQMSQNIQRKMKKLLDIDEKTINIYKSWATSVEDKFNSYQSSSHQGLLQFYLSGKGLIESGKNIIIQLKHQQSKSTEQANKFVDELGVFFNDGPCLNSLHKIVQLYENQRQLQKKLGSAFAEKENSKIFANVQFSYEDIKQRVKTQAHQDDESLLELVDEFQQNHTHSVIATNILNESMVKLQKNTPTKMARPSITGTPTSKPIPKKRPFVSQKEFATHREQKPKQEKKELMPRQMIKKKMRAIKLPQKYEKMMEGVLTDSVQTVDFTNAELGDAISVQICELMKSNTKSRNLKFIRNKITDDGFAKLIPLLTAFSSINLSQNLLTQNCLNVLADQRPSLPNLKTVILSQNKISERKCKALVQRLKKMDLAISI